MDPGPVPTSTSTGLSVLQWMSHRNATRGAARPIKPEVTQAMAEREVSRRWGCLAQFGDACPGTSAMAARSSAEPLENWRLWCSATLGPNRVCELSETFMAERRNLTLRTAGHIHTPRSLKDD